MSKDVGLQKNARSGIGVSVLPEFLFHCQLRRLVAASYADSSVFPYGPVLSYGTGFKGAFSPVPAI